MPSRYTGRPCASPTTSATRGRSACPTKTSARSSTTSGGRGDALCGSLRGDRDLPSDGRPPEPRGTLSNAGGYRVELGDLRGGARAARRSPRARARHRRARDARSARCRAWPRRIWPSEGRPRTRSSGSTLGVAGGPAPAFPDLDGNCRLDRARATAALGRPEERIADLRRRRTTVNDPRATVGTDAGKIGFLDRGQEVFEELAVALFAAAPRDRGPRSRRGRARPGAGGPALAALRSPASQPTARLSARSAARRPAPGALRPPAAATSGRRSRGCARMDPGARELRRGRERRGSTRSAALPPASTPRSSNTSPRKDACYVWVVTPDGTLHATAPRRATGPGLPATSGSPGGARSPPHRRRARRRPRAADARARRGSSSHPIAAWLPRKSRPLVIIVPHGPLALVPFAALPDGAGTPLARTTHAGLCSGRLGLPLHGRRRVRVTGAAAPGSSSRTRSPPAGAGLTPLPGARREA